MVKIRSEKSPYFINIIEAPKFMQMEGLETTILTGLHGEKIMMVFILITLRVVYFVIISVTGTQ